MTRYMLDSQFHCSYLESREVPKKTRQNLGEKKAREIQEKSTGNYLPFISGDATSGDITAPHCFPANDTCAVPIYYSCRVNQFFFWQLFLSGTYGIYFFLINWTLRMSDNLPERVEILGHAHILCITVRDNRIFCCQIVCDLLLKSVFEQIFNVM